MASSRTRSNSFQRSISPSGRYCGSSNSFAKNSNFSSGFASSRSSFSSGFASSSSSFSSPSTSFFTRSTSPTRVNMYGSTPSSPSVRFSIDRPISPSRSITASTRDQVVKTNSNRLTAPKTQKRTCMCSPTTHPGSFRCSLHKNFNNNHHHSGSFSSNGLNARRSAMTNSLVRIGTVEGDLMKRALAALIRPSSHQQKRRAAFQPRPSRLSIMTKADDL